MRGTLLSLALVTALAAFAVGLDYALGSFGQTGETRVASGQFRREAAPLALRTRHLVPNVEHRYPSEISNGTGYRSRLFRTDTLGTVLGPDAADEAAINVLFLGGSTTEANEVDEPYRFPFLAGRLLSEQTGKQIRGVNLGIRGNTSRDSANLLLNHPAAAQAAIVVVMHNINDRLLLAQRHSYRAWLSDGGDTSWQAVEDSLTGFMEAVWDFATHRSNVLFLLRYKLLARNPWTGEAGGVAVDERAIDFPDTDMEASTAAFAQSLASLVEIVRALEKQPILMTQPLGRASRGQNTFNDAVRRVAADRDTPLIDLDKGMPAERDWLFLSDGIHFNNEGSRAVARMVAARIGATVFGAAMTAPRISVLEELDFSVCREAPAAGGVFAPGRPRPLLKVHGRYPVFSADERYIALQQWTGSREIVSVVDRLTGEMSQVSPDQGNESDRHATFVLERTVPTIVFARARPDRTEDLYVAELGSNRAKRVPLPKDLAASIPASTRDDTIVFAGTKRDEHGEVREAPDLYALALNAGIVTRLTRTPWEEWRPAPSPDGHSVYYIANREHDFDIYQLDVHTGQQSRIYGSASDEWDPDISPDGRWLVFASKQTGSWNLYLLETAEPENVIQLTSAVSDEWDPHFLPRSPVVAFASSLNDAAPRMHYLCPFGEQEATR